MANLNTVTCEICSVQKKNTNHWWTAYSLKDEYGRPAGTMIIPFGSPVIAWPFKKAKLPAPTAHLCGQAHVQVWMEKQLDATAKVKRIGIQIIAGQPVPK